MRANNIHFYYEVNNNGVQHTHNWYALNGYAHEVEIALFHIKKVHKLTHKHTNGANETQYLIWDLKHIACSQRSFETITKFIMNRKNVSNIVNAIDAKQTPKQKTKKNEISQKIHITYC